MSGVGLSGTGVTLGAAELIALRGAVAEQRRGPVRPSSLPGGFALRKRGQGQVIADNRAYVHGDDLRHLDRGATARTGVLHVRTFHEERDRVSFLVADFRPSMLWGMKRALRSVAAAEALAWLGWQAVDAGGRVGLMALTGESRVIVRTQSRTRGMLAVIGGMVRAHAAALSAAGRGQVQDDPPLDRALEDLGRIVPRGASVIIASALDARGPGFDTALGELSQHRTPQFLLIGDGALEDLPAGYYPLSAPGGGRFRALFRGRTAAADPAASLAGYDVARIDAGEPVAEALRQAAPWP
ncbi:DUF58 domain-containing protein [Oceaniglobus roseus]|uniref:DUF58 domain-containing protein n=1 Tax=Oceaniglobus roseus TaxID=1737570 RepID=UPI000C7F5BA1|nr:DUF58 domain-containing protein [Kandeliimicrobium roseum]